MGPSIPTKNTTILKDKFSIVMPCYNAENTINRAILSVITQTYENFELIIINDGSTDESESIVRSQASKDKRIVFYSWKKNQGVSFARNKAHDLSTGQFLAFLDADDTWPNNKLETYLDYFKRGHDLVFSEYVRHVQAKRTLISLPRRLSFNELLKSNYIGLSTGAYDLTKIPFVPFQTTGHEDYLMWLTLFPKAANPIGIREPLMHYFANNGSLSANKLRASRWTWEIYRKHLGLGVMKSLFYFFHYVQKHLKSFLLL